jgi:hypothetical protein
MDLGIQGRPTVRIDQVATHLTRLIRGVIPAICTTRSERLTTNRTYCVTKPLIVHTSTLKQSLAAKSFQCAFRKVDQVVRLLRSGAGSMPLRFKTFATVPLATVCFRFANAPWMRV